MVATQNIDNVGHIWTFSLRGVLVLCSIHQYDDVSSQRFDNTSIDTAGPVSILWHVCSSGPRLI